MITGSNKKGLISYFFMVRAKRIKELIQCLIFLFNCRREANQSYPKLPPSVAITFVKTSFLSSTYLKQNPKQMKCCLCSAM